MLTKQRSTSILITIGILAILIIFFSYTEIWVIRPSSTFSYEGETQQLVQLRAELKSSLDQQSKDLKDLRSLLLSLDPSSSSAVLDNTQIVQSLEKQFREIQSLKALLTPKKDLMLDLEDLPHLAGPKETPTNTNRSLVVICVGKGDKEGVNRLVTKYFNSSSFTLMLFHYDDASYDEFAWYHSRDVVAIRVLHKMKYWYIKRFLTPAIAKTFKHIILLDGDVDFEAGFSADSYVNVMDAFNLHLTQPAHFAKTTSLHRNITAQPGLQIGRYRDFIECGPAVFMSTEGYQCIYDLIQPDLTSGWGLDIYWVDYLRNVCGFGNKAAAILDVFVLIHETPSGQGAASSNDGFNGRAWGELLTYEARFPQLTKGWALNFEGEFGNRNCYNTSNPAAASC